VSSNWLRSNRRSKRAPAGNALFEIGDDIGGTYRKPDLDDPSGARFEPWWGTPFAGSCTSGHVLLG